MAVHEITASMGPATSVTGTGHSSPMICRSVTTFATTAVLELRGLLVPVLRRSPRRGCAFSVRTRWRTRSSSRSKATVPRIGRREDVRRSMLHRREKSGCILMRCSGGFVRILKDGTAEWKKGATTSTSSPRARSDDRDDDEDPFLRSWNRG